MNYKNPVFNHHSTAGNVGESDRIIIDKTRMYPSNSNVPIREDVSIA